MNTLSIWTRTLCILALAAGTWPLAATGPSLPWTAGAPGPGLRELRIQAFTPDPNDVQADSYFILDSPVPLPPQDLEVFWTAPEREDWVPLAHSVPGEDFILAAAPVREPGAPGGLEFLVMIQGRPWARGTYDPVPVPGEDAPPPAPAAPSRTLPEAGEPKVPAALALGPGGGLVPPETPASPGEPTLPAGHSSGARCLAEFVRVEAEMDWGRLASLQDAPAPPPFQERAGEDPGTGLAASDGEGEDAGNGDGFAEYGEEDAGDEADAEEPGAPGSGAVLRPRSGFLEGRTYLLQLARQYGLTAVDLVRASRNHRLRLPADIYLLYLDDSSGPRRTMSYALAADCADALNLINRIRDLREAPFTADELFLGGRSLKDLAGAELLKFILLKDRHLTGEGAPAQRLRLGVARLALQLRVNGQSRITQAFADGLKARLDLPALGLTPADLDRLPSAPGRPFQDHPGHERARALVLKAMKARGTREEEPILKTIGLSKSHWSIIRLGKQRISRKTALKLSDFHNRTFPGEPPVTPDHFLGK